MSDQQESWGGSESPAFDPVSIRARHDGWTPERQRMFIGALRRTRNVRQACAEVGMSRMSAYQLRDKPGAESFAAAWDAAVAPSAPKGVTSPSLLWHRAFYGVARPIIRNGEEVGVVVKPDNAALLRLFDRLDRSIARRGS